MDQVDWRKISGIVIGYIAFPLLLYFSVIWMAATLRLVSNLLFLGVLWAYFRYIRGRRSKLPFGLWLVAFLTTLLPVDISFHDVSGPPRFVPLVMGLPGSELMKEAARGNVVLGGCLVTGYEAKWVLVW